MSGLLRRRRKALGQSPAHPAIAISVIRADRRLQRRLEGQAGDLGPRLRHKAGSHFLHDAVCDLHPRKGTYGTQLHATLPHFSGKWGYITGISLNLGATSHKRSYISAACRAPKGFGKASFSLTEAKLSFEGHGPVSQTLQRSCGVR